MRTHHALVLALASLPLAACAVSAADSNSNEESIGSNSSAVICPARGCLGDRPPIERPPIFTITLPNPEDFIEITAGVHHTCARKNNGNVYCWGINDHGQTGTGPTTTCSGVNCVNRPRQVGLGAAMQVDAGGYHTCALDTSGAAYCWGYGNNGQVGVVSGGQFPVPVYGDFSSPMAVSGGLTFSSISGGTYSTCGTSSSGLYCWGGIMYGGGAANTGVGVPTPVTTPSGATVQGYSSVSVGYLHGCALFVVGGWRSVDCWGYNRYGQAGQDPATWPNVIATLATMFGSSVGRVKTEDNFTCVDQNDGTVQCIGYGGWGQLGNGQFNQTHQPQSVGNGQALHGVDTGINHACALDPNGAAYCWGNGYWGQLGNAVSGVSASPVAVGGGHTYRAIAAGYLHTCAIGTDNHIYCWGSNTYGQLGTQYPGGWVSSPVQAIDP
jgi:alpha-tubulin suppressor-like RCC1 family protein